MYCICIIYVLSKNSLRRFIGVTIQTPRRKTGRHKGKMTFFVCYLTVIETEFDIFRNL